MLQLGCSTTTDQIKRTERRCMTISRLREAKYLVVYTLSLSNVVCETRWLIDWTGQFLRAGREREIEREKEDISADYSTNSNTFARTQEKYAGEIISSILFSLISISLSLLFAFAFFLSPHVFAYVQNHIIGDEHCLLFVDRINQSIVSPSLPNNIEDEHQQYQPSSK